MAVATVPDWTADEAGTGEGDGRGAPSEFVVRAEAIRKRLRLTQKRFALDYAGCSPQEYNRFVRGGRDVTRRVEEHLVVYFPELRPAYMRSLLARAERSGVRPIPLPGRRRRKTDPLDGQRPGEGGVSPG